MYGNKSTKRKKDGTLNNPFYYYGCKHRRMDRGHKCEYKKQVPEKLMDHAINEIIIKLVSNPRFSELMQQKIAMKVDTSVLEQEIITHEKHLRQYHLTKANLIDEIDNLDPDDKHYVQIKADLDERLYHMYDKIEQAESELIDARAKKKAIEEDKVRADNIYRILSQFEKLYAVLTDKERQEVLQALIAEIHIHETPQPNGQWLKSIKFRLPIIDGKDELSLDNQDGVETVVQLSQQKPDDTIHVGIDLKPEDVTAVESKATYDELKVYIKEKYGFKVSNLYIAQAKAALGIKERENYNKPKTPNGKKLVCPPDKMAAIQEALRHFKMI